MLQVCWEGVYVPKSNKLSLAVYNLFNICSFFVIVGDLLNCILIFSFASFLLYPIFRLIYLLWFRFLGLLRVSRRKKSELFALYTSSLSFKISQRVQLKNQCFS